MLLKVLSFKFKGWAHNAGTDIPVPVPIKTVILPDRFLPSPRLAQINQITPVFAFRGVVFLTQTRTESGITCFVSFIIHPLLCILR